MFKFKKTKKHHLPDDIKCHWFKVKGMSSIFLIYKIDAEKEKIYFCKHLGMGKGRSPEDNNDYDWTFSDWRDCLRKGLVEIIEY